MKKIIIVSALLALCACDPEPTPNGTEQPQPPREEEQCGPDEVCAYP